MAINRFDSVHKPAPAPQMSILGIIFFMMGAPNMYAFFQRRADNATYKGGGVPRYALWCCWRSRLLGILSSRLSEPHSDRQYWN